MLDGLDDLYRKRFSNRELQQKNFLWSILTTYFFQKYVKKFDTVLDVGAGYCEFINNISARRKIAVDLNRDVEGFADPGVEIVINRCSDMSGVKSGTVDVVFISNILEHLRNNEEVEQTLLEARRVLKVGGTLMILQPNIKYAYREYWDFFDHVVPISDAGLVEGLRKCNYQILEVRSRFLPFSTKTSLPKIRPLMILYLRLRILQNLFGKQLFVAAKKTSA
jgi:ubiquinone/menaquinone biosynthesis C-methylase UbiE